MLEGKKQDAFEALVGDWIGEVGQLHRRIQELPVALDAALSPTKLSFRRAQDELMQQLETLPGAADKEMKRAGAEVLTSLAREVGRISQKIAGDAAEAEKGKAILLATKWTVAGVLACAVVFGGTGYGVRMLADEASLSIAKKRLDDAYASNDSVKQMAIEEIASARKDSGWVGTDEGRLAKQFFDSGAGLAAARCNSPVWEIVVTKNGKYCVPKRRDLFGGDEDKYGWKIP